MTEMSLISSARAMEHIRLAAALTDRHDILFNLAEQKTDKLECTAGASLRGLTFCYLP